MTRNLVRLAIGLGVLLGCVLLTPPAGTQELSGSTPDVQALIRARGARNSSVIRTL